MTGTPAFKDVGAESLLFILNQLDLDKSFKTTIEEVRGRVVEASRYQHYSLPTLYQKFIANYGNYKPMFDVGVLYDQLSPFSGSLRPFQAPDCSMHRGRRLVSASQSETWCHPNAGTAAAR